MPAAPTRACCMPLIFSAKSSLLMPSAGVAGASRGPGQLGRLARDELLCATLMLAVLLVLLPHSQPFFSSLFPQLDRSVYSQERVAQLLCPPARQLGV